MKRDPLPKPWRWCTHAWFPVCVKCHLTTDPPTEQVVEFRGDHYHAHCALEVAVGIIEQNSVLRMHEYSRRMPREY